MENYNESIHLYWFLFIIIGVVVGRYSHSNSEDSNDQLAPPPLLEYQYLSIGWNSHALHLSNKHRYRSYNLYWPSTLANSSVITEQARLRMDWNTTSNTWIGRYKVFYPVEDLEYDMVIGNYSIKNDMIRMNDKWGD